MKIISFIVELQT